MTDTHAASGTSRPTGRADPGGHPRGAGPDWKATLRGALQRVKSHDVPSLAAGIAFKMFLSLFPALLAVVAIFSQVVDPETVLRELRGVVPEELLEDVVGQRLEGLARTRGAGWLALAGIVGGLWSASSAAVTLMKALNRINGVTEQRSFIAQRAVALLLTAALLVALAAILALVVLGPQLQTLLVPDELGALGGVLVGLGQAVGAIVVLMLLFAFVYGVAPNRDRFRWRLVSAGAAVGVVGWLLLSVGFTVFTQTLGNYEETYGAIASVIVTLLWLQLSMLMLLLGAEIDVQAEAYFEQQEAIAEGAGVGMVEPPTVAAGRLARAAPGRPAGEPAASDSAISSTPSPVAAGVTAPRSTHPAAPDVARVPRPTAALAGLGALAVAVAVAVRQRR